jgi:hypothetical protein
MKMKIKTQTKLLILMILAPLVFFFNNCSMGHSAKNGQNSSSSTGGDDGTEAYVITGTGALGVPTGDALAARLVNGMEGSVSSGSGNFAKAFNAMKANLPKVTDPTKATGFDQSQLLVYAACSDLTTGGTPIMQSKYGVSKTGTGMAPKIVAAGVRMMDQYTAGLASQGPTSADVSQALNDLVSKMGAKSNTMVFMAVCVAANTAGSSLMSF